jgi:hypothetical protein
VKPPDFAKKQKHGASKFIQASPRSAFGNFRDNKMRVGIAGIAAVALVLLGLTEISR